MKKEKSKKEILRNEKWKKRICITEDNYQFVYDVMIRKKYKTMAGTLDFIINQHKNAKINF